MNASRIWSEAAARVGFDGVEVMEADLLAYEGSPADVRRIAEDLGITIDLYQPFRDFEGMPGPLRDKAFSRAERAGAVFVLVTGRPPRGQGHRGQDR